MHYKYYIMKRKKMQLQCDIYCASVYKRNGMSFFSCENKKTPTDNKLF